MEHVRTMPLERVEPLEPVEPVEPVGYKYLSNLTSAS